MGDESLDADEVGIGLDGAENMGQDGERGEVGLGFGGLQDRTTRKLVSTQGNHDGSTRFMGGQMMGSWSRRGAPKPRLRHQRQVILLRTRCLRLPSSGCSAVPWSINVSLCPAQLLSRSRELLRWCPLCLCPLVEDTLGPRTRTPTQTLPPACLGQGKLLRGLQPPPPREWF